MQADCVSAKDCASNKHRFTLGKGSICLVTAALPFLKKAIIICGVTQQQRWHPAQQRAVDCSLNDFGVTVAGATGPNK